MAGRDLSAELFGSSAKPGAGRDLSAELFGEKPKEEGFFSNVGKLAYEGGERAIGAAKLSPSVISGNVGPDQAGIISQQLSMKPSVQPKELTEVQGAFKDEAEALKKAEGFKESVGPTLQFMAEFGKQALTNPKGIAYLTAQSAANMAPSIAGMIAGGKGGAALGSLAGPVGTAAGAVTGSIAGGFAGSAPMEIGAEFMDNVGKELRARNMEPTEDNVKSLLQDKSFVEKAVSESRTKGVTTAAVDAATTAGAGRFATGPARAAMKTARAELGAAADAAKVASRADEILKQGTKAERAGRAIKRGAGAVGIDVAGGGASEAAGQYAAYGEIDPESIGLEMLGELGGSAIEVPGAAYATGKDALKAKAKTDAADILNKERAAQPEQPQDIASALKAAGMQETQPSDLDELERQTGMASVKEEPAVEPAKPVAPVAEEPAAPPAEPVSPPAPPAAPAVEPAAPAAPVAAEPPADETPEQKLRRLSQRSARMTDAFRDRLITNQEYEAFQAELEAARAAAKKVPADTSELSPAKQEILKIADQLEAAGVKGFPDGMRLNARLESREPSDQMMDSYRSKLNDLAKPKEDVVVDETPYGLNEFFSDSAKDQARINGLMKSGKPKVRFALGEANDTIQKLADTIRNAGYNMDSLVPGQVPPAILRIKSQIGVLAAGANRLANNAEAVEKGHKRADPKRIGTDAQELMNDIAAADELVAYDQNVPTATEQMEGTEVPPTPEVEELMDKQRKANEDISTMGKRTAGTSLMKVLEGQLADGEISELGGKARKIGKNPFVSLVAKKGKPGASMENMVDSGSLDLFLPDEMRPGAEGYDNAESAEYIRDKLRAGEYYTHAMRQEIDAVQRGVWDLEKEIDELLTIEDINKEIQYALEEQRRADQEAAEPAAPEETGTAAESPEQKAEELITSQTEEELKRKQAEIDRLSKENERLAKEAERKAKADEEAGDFVLTGSDRPADKAAARGQMELTEEPAEEERPSTYMKALESLGFKKIPRGNERAYKDSDGKEYTTLERDGVRLVVRSGTFLQSNDQGGVDVYQGDPEEWMIQALIVDKDQRNKGLGSKAMQDVVGLAGDYGIDLYLEPTAIDGGKMSKDELADFYSKFGFKYQFGALGGKSVMFREAKGGDTENLLAADKAQTGYSIDPEEQRVEKELTGKTMVQAADWAVKNAPNAFMRVIAEKVRNRLRELERRGVEFDFKVEGGNMRSRDMFASRGVTNFKWGDDQTKISVRLNGAAALNNQNGYPPGTRYETVLHELLHVATRAQFKFLSPNDGLGKQMVELTNAIIKRFNEDAKAGKLPPIMERYYKRLNNALEDPDEVLAWGLTNKEVQDYYADIKVGDKSVMTRLVELMRQVLGLGKPYESALDRLVTLSESMLDTNIGEIESIMGARGKKLGKARAPVQESLFQGEKQKPLPTDSAAFKRWSKGLPLVEADYSGSYNGGPAVFEAFHGTTHDDITEFQVVGNKEGALGAGPYMSTSVDDVNENYAGVGPDLTNRIGREEDNVRDSFYDDAWTATDILNDYFAAEGIDQEVTDDNIDELKDEYGDAAITHAATARLKGKSDGLVMPVYVRMEKPFNMATNPTYFEMNYPEDENGEPDYEAEPEGNAMDLINAVNRVAGWYNADADSLTGWVYENAADGVSAREVFDRAAKDMSEIYDDNGEMISSGQFMQEVAREMGFDGLIQDADAYFGTQRRGFGGIRAGAMKGVQPGTLHLMPFDGKQIKSATGNRGTYDPNDRDIRNQRERQNVLGEPVLGNWTLQPDTKLDTKDSFIYKLLDKNIDIKRVVQAITKEAGEIASRWNPYLQEELYHGRTAKETQDFMTKEMKPLLQEMGKDGITIGEFEEYLQNRHAEEYNNQVAKVNKNNPDMQDGGSGIKTAAARKYLADLSDDQRAKYESLAKKIDAITKGTRELLVKSGMEKRETIDAWENAFPNYVPLQREQDDFEYTISSTGTGRGFDVRGAFSRRAMGSNKKVIDVIANIALSRERAIVKANKNRVAQAVYGLAVQNANPSFWMAVNPLAEKIPEAAIEELRDMGIEESAIEFLMKEPRQRAVDPKRNEVVNRINSKLRDSDYVLSMRLNGENRYVFFNPNDDRAKRAVTALKNLDAEQLGQVMGTIAKVTRWMSAINTQYNPIFGAYNFLRDVQGAALQLSDTPLAGKQGAVLKSTIPAMRAIYASMRGERKGKDVDTEMAKLWTDFQKAGGQTGFRDMYSRSQDRAEALQKELAMISDGKLKSLGRGMFNLLSDYNDTMENAVRLAAYKTALESGIGKEEAASIAKNLTVNFNKKGQIATQAGALYAFFNAAMQGSARMYKTLTGPAGKKIMAGGLIWGAIQASLLAFAGFDDEEPPEFVRERNFIIPIGNKKYIAFPMPLGYHVIPGTSRIITEWALSGFKDTPERIASMTGMYLEAFNPIGNAGWSVQTIAPTFADPIVALAENRDWTGKPIAKKDFNALDPTPGYLRAKDAASWLSTQVAKFMNYASGGTKYQPGVLSPTPDQIDYLIGQATGGLGREALKASTSIEKTYTGEELPAYKIPVVGRFYGEAKGSAAEASRFYKNLERLNKLENEIKGRRENKEPLGDFLSEHPEARLAKRAHEIQSDLKKLRERKEKLIERDAPRESIKVVEEQMTRKMKLLNDRVAEFQK